MKLALALVATLVLTAQADVVSGHRPDAQSDEKPRDFVKFEKLGYHECFGAMGGHEAPEAALSVCAAGNGSYRDRDGVLAAIRATDWFPYTEFSTLVGEVRVTCRQEGTLARSIVFPSRGERGKRARVELPCSLDGPAAKRGLATARKVLRLVLKKRDRAARAAARIVTGCARNPQSEPCRRFQKSVLEVLAGSSTGEVNARPFSFKLAGFEFRAGLETAAARGNEDVASADPVTRLRATLKMRDEMEDSDWRTLIESTLKEISADGQVKLIEEALTDPDAHVRNWGADNISLMPEERREALALRMLDDADDSVRSKAIPYIVRLGEAGIAKALNDSAVVNRMLAYDVVLSHFEAQKSYDRLTRYLEQAQGDQDESIRAMAEGKLTQFKQQVEYIRERRPGWEDGELTREIASPK